MEQENWINEILESTNGITPAVPDPQLFARIQDLIEAHRKVAPQWIWLAAAGIILLVLLNIKVLSSAWTKEANTTEILVSSVNKSNQLY